MLRQLIVSAAVLASIAYTPLSHADVSGTTTVNTFTYTLRDLNPTDGIAPSIAFAPSQGINAAITVLLYLGEQTTYDEAYGTGKESLFVLESIGPELWMSGNVDGRASFDTLSLSGSAYASSVGDSDGVMPVFTGYFDFILSPYTEITFSALIDVDAHADATEAGFEYISNVSMTIAGGWTHVMRRNDLFHVANFGEAPRNLDLTTPISVARSNPSGSPMSMEMHLLISNQVFSHVGAVPIPEPGRLPMLATGLLALGAFARLGRKARPATPAPPRN